VPKNVKRRVKILKFFWRRKKEPGLWEKCADSIPEMGGEKAITGKREKKKLSCCKLLCFREAEYKPDKV